MCSLRATRNYGFLYEPTTSIAASESAASWTRQQFDLEPDDAARARRYDFLNKLRVRVVERVGPNGAEPANGSAANGTGANGAAKPGDHLLAVHGSPRRPINEYIFPDDAINATDKLQ